MRNAIVASVVMLAFAAAPALAGARKASPAAKKTSDPAFVMAAAQANMAEIELGKLAETRGSNELVKTFARRMVDDHQKALDNLKMIATNDKIAWPSTLDQKDQALKDRLAKLSGKAFDDAYMRAMVTDHRKDVAEFREESKEAKQTDIKGYASSTLPTLEAHLKLAQDTDRSLVGTSGMHSSKKSGTE